MNKRFIDLGFDMALLDVQGEVVGKAEKEIEHVWYGRLPQDSQLADLSKQSFVTRHLQEQASGAMAFNPNTPNISTMIRVRRVDRAKSVITRKTRVNGVAGNVEKSLEINDEQFEFWCEVFGSGINKMRYTISPVGFAGKLELDVFLDKFGHPTGLAKYDYEVKDQSTPLPPIPITLLEQVYFDPFNPTDESVAALRSFMKAQSFLY